MIYHFIFRPAKPCDTEINWHFYPKKNIFTKTFPRLLKSFLNMTSDTQLYISCETIRSPPIFGRHVNAWKCMCCMFGYSCSVCDVLLQLVTVVFSLCSVTVVPSPPSVFKQLPSNLELPGRLSGLPVPGIKW